MSNLIAETAIRISPHTGERWQPWRYPLFICEAIVRSLHRKGGGRLIINAPPRHGKSLTTSLWLPVAFLEALPRGKVILVSYEADIAAAWGRRVRDTFAHPSLSTAVNQKKAAGSNWETTAGGGMRTAGSGGAITGTGFHLGIVDDPTKDWRDAHSPTMRKHLIDWFESTFYTRAEPGATIIVNQTRWHQHDLTGWLLKEHTDDWDHIVLPALAEDGDPMGRAVGEALCPERYDAPTLERTRLAVGSSKWAGLYQQRPVPAEGSIIKPHWLRYYSTPPAGMSQVGISVDASFKETVAGSYVVLQAWGRKGADYYLLDQIRERIDFVATLSALKALIGRWPGCRARWIEDKANGSAIISSLRAAVSGVIAINPKGSKEARAQAVAPLFEAGNVWLPSNVPWLSDYVSELTTFPSAANDDQVDATTQALLKMTETRRAAGGGFGGVVPH